MSTINLHCLNQYHDLPALGAIPFRSRSRFLEHLLTLVSYLELTAIRRVESRRLVHALTNMALQIDRGIVIAIRTVGFLRQRQVVIPPIMIIDRSCSQALARVNRPL